MTSSSSGKKDSIGQRLMATIVQDVWLQTTHTGVAVVMQTDCSGSSGRFGGTMDLAVGVAYGGGAVRGGLLKLRQRRHCRKDGAMEDL
ncbi:urea transporter [Sesbania bispinosa]|nr:urea transporter [Sesbania bispinosa]